VLRPSGVGVLVATLLNALLELGITNEFVLLSSCVGVSARFERIGRRDGWW